MTIPLLTSAGTVMCPHGGTVDLSSSSSDIKADGASVCLQTDQHTVSGCAFTIPGVGPSPCVLVRWQTGTTQSNANGVAFLNQASVGLCHAATQAPQGPAVIANCQTAAKGV